LFYFNAWMAEQLPGSQVVYPAEYEVQAYLRTGDEETACVHCDDGRPSKAGRCGHEAFAAGRGPSTTL
jgi:hypothetical protein